MQFFKIEIIAKLGDRETRKFEYNICVVYFDEISRSILHLVEQWEGECLEWDYMNIVVFQLLEKATTFFFAGQIRKELPPRIQLL